MPEERAIAPLSLSRFFSLPRWATSNPDYVLPKVAEKLASVRKGKNGTAVPPPWLTAQRKRAAKKHGRMTASQKHTARGGRRTRRR